MAFAKWGNCVGPDHFDESDITASVFREVLEALDRGRTLDALELALRGGGPIEEWSGPDNMRLAARLARHLGDAGLSWRLASKAYGQRPRLARFLTDRIYASIERRGIFSAWQIAQRFAQCQSETPLEKAEALVCQAGLGVIGMGGIEVGMPVMASSVVGVSVGPVDASTVPMRNPLDGPVLGLNVKGARSPDGHSAGIDSPFVTFRHDGFNQIAGPEPLDVFGPRQVARGNPSLVTRVL